MSKGFLFNKNHSAVTITCYKDSEVILAIVHPLFSGEIYYTVYDQQSRLIRQQGFSSIIYGQNLPLPLAAPTNQRTGRAWRNVASHPQRTTKSAHIALLKAKVSKIIDNAEQIGGSPAHSMVRTGLDGSAFLTKWHGKTTAWDLACGIQIVRNMPGGQVTTLDGAPAKLVGHTGFLVASAREELHKIVLEILKTEGVKKSFDFGGWRP